jgi:tetracycline repressor-like protein
MTAQQMMVLDEALAEFEIPEADPARWTDQLIDVAHQIRAVIGRHRDTVPTSIGTLPWGGHALRFHERVIAILRAGGLSDGRSVAAVQLLWIIVNGFSLEEASSPAGAPAIPDRSPMVNEYFDSLPSDRYPNLVAVATEFAAPVNMNERFELLTGAFIEGLAYRAGHS